MSGEFLLQSGAPRPLQAGRSKRYLDAFSIHSLSVVTMTGLNSPSVLLLERAKLSLNPVDREKP